MEYFLVIVIFILLYTLRIYYYSNEDLKQKLKNFEGYTVYEKNNFWSIILQPIVDLYQKHNFILYFIVSIVFYVLAYQEFEKIQLFGNYYITSQSLSNIFTSIGTVILSSGVFSSITKSKHFLTIFSNEIKEIVYTKEFLSKQKNIDEIWNVVTKSICKENFHKISDELFEKIKSNYLPINHNFYYQDFKLEIMIKIDENDNNFITIEEITRVDLICENTKSINYTFATNIDYNADCKDKTSYKLDAITVNGCDRKDDIPNEATVYDDENNVLKTNVLLELVDEKVYSIYRKETKTYSIKLNAHRIHSALKIYYNFDLMIHYPSKIDIRFSKLGINNNWEDVEIKDINDDIKLLTTKYEGIFFQNQGFMLNFFVNT